MRSGLDNTLDNAVCNNIGLHYVIIIQQSKDGVVGGGGRA